MTDSGKDAQEPEALTEGERIFESYLHANKLTWKKEQPFGLKQPDYLVQASTGEVLCEVKDFGEGKLDKAARKAVLSTMRPFLSDGDDYTRKADAELQRLQNVEACSAGAWNPFPRLQEKLAKAAEQLRPAKGKLPCVVVIYNPGFMPHERDLIVRIGLGKNRFFTANQSTTVSALAVLDLLYPNKELLTRQLDEKADEVRKQFAEVDRTPDREVAVAILDQVGELEAKLRAQYAEGFFEEAVPYLRIYHNKYAVMALPIESFTGEHDEHISHSNLWESSDTSLIGAQIISQTSDWTCNHCGALTGVTITADDPVSQQWTCSNCLGKIDVQKLAEGQQLIQRGVHGPKSNINGTAGRCCLPMVE